MNTIFIPRTEGSFLETVARSRLVAAFHAVRGLVWRPRRILIRSRRAQGIAECGLGNADCAGIEGGVVVGDSTMTGTAKNDAPQWRVDPAWIPPEGFFVFAVMGSIGTVLNLF